MTPVTQTKGWKVTPHTSDEVHTTRAYPGFFSMKNLRCVVILPLDGMLAYRSAPPPHQLNIVVANLYTWVKRKNGDKLVL